MNFPVSAPRKRPRDVLFDSFSVSRNNKFSSVSSIVVDYDVVSQIQQQHRQEIDLLIAQHIERVRLEIKERKKRQLRASGQIKSGHEATAPPGLATTVKKSMLYE
ncbi:hypothetical protein V6N11_006370 [Hibiscus sabdariffa]|uniref:Uncharacterized protein n=1 Tax=Hibiscus sabdariffa TaxID=183260 RepID=A0ABR2RQX5_9ROSI